jgi:hypothetical protein
MSGVENHFEELFKTQGTVINLITRQGPDYFTGNFAEKMRFMELINRLEKDFVLSIKEKVDIFGRKVHGDLCDNVDMEKIVSFLKKAGLSE